MLTPGVVSKSCSEWGPPKADKISLIKVYETFNLGNLAHENKSKHMDNKQATTLCH